MEVEAAQIIADAIAKGFESLQFTFLGLGLVFLALNLGRIMKW